MPIRSQDCALTTPAGFAALYRREANRVLRFCTRRGLDAETGVGYTQQRKPSMMPFMTDGRPNAMVGTAVAKLR